MTPSISSGQGRSRRFQTTRWSLVLQARNAVAPPARLALAELCQAYWLPLYGFVRARSTTAHEAQDLTQAFFERLLDKDFLADVNPAHGRFRSFLLAAASHFLSNERDRARAVKRGGRISFQSLDWEMGESRFLNEPVDRMTPERLFERQWARAVLDRVLDQLRQEFEAAGRGEVFNVLSEHLSAGGEQQSYADAARALGTSEQTARVAAHRLRKRYRRLLKEEIAQTTSSPEETEDELRCLFAALSSQ